MTTPTTDQLIKRYGPPDDCAQDPDGPDNMQRVAWATEAVRTYATCTHKRLPTVDSIANDPDLVRELVGDLVCDLLHLAECAGVHANEIVTIAYAHFSAEVGLGYELKP